MKSRLLHSLLLLSTPHHFHLVLKGKITQTMARTRDED
jgi:hypothetical protein